MTPDDEKLRDAFAELKRDDARRAPTFQAMRTRPRVRPLRAVMVALPAFAAAAALLLVLAPPERPEPRASVSARSATSRAVLAERAEEPLPLDFLLETHALYIDSTEMLGVVRAGSDSDFLLRAPHPLRGQTP